MCQISQTPSTLDLQTYDANTSFLGVMQKKAKRKTSESGGISNKRSMLDENELLYSQQVQIYTDRVSAGGNAGNLVSACLAAARQMGNQSIEAIWSLVDDMLKVGLYTMSRDITVP